MNSNKTITKKAVYKVAGAVLLLSLLTVYWISLPSGLFSNPTSTVIEDKTGVLLGAKIADDGQWRFPHNSYVPEKFKLAIIEFEDRHFYKHPGFNSFSLLRAAYQNIKSGRIVSGGSTLTMQVIRLSRKGKPRTILEKIREIVLATRLELSNSKSEILSMYASNAPFGGNVVGLDAASWRYYGRNPDRLSWSEMATLAVLPNAPSLIYPGKNQQKLLIKRDALLDKLLAQGYLDTISCELAKTEPLPGKPLPLPQLAPHLLT
ncbi:MAG: transglycosylase domain-containing protein, partial [Bacteroidales bacterium]|nr:transglycosylase domain-containing protein [Bacteroidales bacterium]